MGSSLTSLVLLNLLKGYWKEKSSIIAEETPELQV